MSRLQDLEEMLDRDPDDPFLQYALAREHENAQSTMQALLIYEHLVNTHPEYIATYYHYAKLLHSLGNRNEAVKLIETGIRQGTEKKDLHAVGEMKGLLAEWLDD